MDYSFLHKSIIAYFLFDVHRYISNHSLCASVDDDINE